jgi:hypothetical protein
MIYGGGEIRGISLSMQRKSIIRHDGMTLLHEVRTSNYFESWMAHRRFRRAVYGGKFLWIAEVQAAGTRLSTEDADRQLAAFCQWHRGKEWGHQQEQEAGDPTSTLREDTGRTPIMPLRLKDITRSSSGCWRREPMTALIVDTGMSSYNGCEMVLPTPHPPPWYFHALYTGSNVFQFLEYSSGVANILLFLFFIFIFLHSLSFCLRVWFGSCFN